MSLLSSLAEYLFLLRWRLFPASTTRSVMRWSYRKGVRPGFVRPETPVDSAIDRPTLIFLADGSVAQGGLCDRLKGIVSLYMTAVKTGQDFRIRFTSPFELSDYLEPALYDWRLREGEFSYETPMAESALYECWNVATISWKVRYLREKSGIDLLADYATHGKLIKHVVTNFTPPADYEDVTCYWSVLFRPSRRLEEALKMYRPAGKYISVSARFLNLMGDFNETSESKPLGEKERESLLAACVEGLRSVVERFPDHEILVTSDSVTFLERVSAEPRVRIVPGVISHVDAAGARGQAEDAGLKTFTDLLLISGAEKVHLLLGEGMYKSGFARTGAAIGGRPFEIVMV